MTGTYPRWRYFPSYAAPPAWIAPLVALFAAEQAQIDSAVTHAKRMESNDVLSVIAPGLQTLGFVVEQGKQKAGKLPRPIFFGDEGSYLRTYEIDAFEAKDGIALEVEAGRATMGNAMGVSRPSRIGKTALSVRVSETLPNLVKGALIFSRSELLRQEQRGGARTRTLAGPVRQPQRRRRGSDARSAQVNLHRLPRDGCPWPCRVHWITALADARHVIEVP